LDFQKTFDTIQHKIILSKFLRHGIRGRLPSSLVHYLSGRQQREIKILMTVLLMAVLIQFLVVSLRVPSLVLYCFCYINDVTSVSERMHFTLFADHTNAFISAPNVDAVMTGMNEELRRFNI
ncbi:hypothetical protein CAPTEDRAFT_140253, partial [Capitella teleta]